MSNETKLVLNNEQLGELEDQLMEIPAKYANPILSWLARELASQRAKGVSLEEVHTVYVDTDKVICQTDGIARKFIKTIGSKSRRKITKL